MTRLLKIPGTLLLVAVMATACATVPPAPATSTATSTSTAASTAQTQPSATAAHGGPQAGPGAQQQQRSIADLTKASRRHDGLFTIFQDTVTGTTRMLIRRDQVGREFIYWSYVVDGVVDAGVFRGAFGDNKVFTVERTFDRITFVQQPTHLHFDPDNALARAADANVSPAIMAVSKIVASDTAKGEYLIETDDVFLAETFQMVKFPAPPTARPGQFFTLGRLSRPKSVVSAVRSYPLNTDVVVDYVYDNDAPLNWGGDGVLDPRFVTIRVQHSLIEMPENDYQVRFEDPRIGYFTNQQTDMISADAAPWRDVITRWHLVKKDPSAAISEPVEPIVWWIENTTPHHLRDIIRDATLAWNEAFESAGFRNAIEVRIQPDDADWDAGDIRYNVLRWTSSPNPPFGGYGPSFTNPRTGQILGADVMLEWVYLTNRIREEQVFGAAALPAFEAFDANAAEPLHAHDRHHCSFGLHMQQTVMFGREALLGLGADETEVQELVRQALAELILHEVGHTLGLNHNMMASYALTRQDLEERGRGALASVMDYGNVNVSLAGRPQGDYYTYRPGPYDHWAIEWGYSTAATDPAAERAATGRAATERAAADPAAERARLDAIAARSTEKALVFGNDADDMRAPGKAIDPRINVNDLSDDAMGWAADRITLTTQLMGTLRQRFDRPGGDFHAMRNAYLVLTGQQASALATTSRFVGGVYRDRAVIGQPGADRPFQPVSRADQKRAMDILAQHAFAPDAWDSPDGVVDHLMMRRRGFNFFAGTEDPKIHERVLNSQRGILAHLLHPATLQRMTDSRLYGNAYPVAEMMTDLTNAVFQADLQGNVNTFRQNLQIEFVRGLVNLYGSSSHDHMSRSAALHNLRRIETMMARKRAGNLETQAHTQHVLHTIRKALEVR
jgi:hypothetical protein